MKILAIERPDPPSGRRDHVADEVRSDALSIHPIIDTTGNYNDTSLPSLQKQRCAKVTADRSIIAKQLVNDENQIYIVAE